eukprot:TRINITY_DN13300_c0_g1_i1.p1 TRINITY_DN13300_c0_g1~~TRINITY_DN13300_c0_g1_i1.p1  ORF type:complete len:1117 (-),score=178.90 TRINITY_DN13300_c0_g1_i1:155-3040(-)
MASPVPDTRDSHVEYGGSPGVGGFWMTCAQMNMRKPSLLISEIMYHPITSINYEDQFEFIEIFNNDSEAVNISQWRIVSTSLRYQFPPLTVIPSKAFMTIVKNRTAFQFVYPSTNTFLGPYNGELKNSGDKVAIIDCNGFVVEYLKFKDESPWPIAPDALGAKKDFLPDDSPFKQNYDRYRYKGHSLSRRSPLWGTGVENWYSTDPSPGISNWDTSSPLLPVLYKHTLTPDKKTIDEDKQVTVTIGLKPWPTTGLTINSIYLTFWIFNPITGLNSAPSIFQFTSSGTDTFSTVIPPQPANSICSYNITINYMEQKSQSFPGVIDPFRSFNYFVSPKSDINTPVYHMFIKPTDWNTIFKVANVSSVDARVEGEGRCFIREDWWKQVPCTLVHKGQVINAFVRLSGSRWNRATGINIPKAQWDHNRPTGGTLRGWSYLFKLPSWNKISGKDEILLNKVWQSVTSCSMYEAPLYFSLNLQAGVAAPTTKFVRLNAQGYFLRYMMEIEDSNFIEDSLDELNPRCIHQTKEFLGHLFKAQGSFSDEGPFGRGEWRYEAPSCTNVINPKGRVEPPWSTLSRYEWTYGRKSYKSWGNHFNTSNLINAFASSNAQASPKNKILIDSFIDKNLFINYLVLLNWAGTWDNTFQNQFAHQRITDGQWSWHPWDADGLFEKKPVTADLFAGDTSETHYLKQCFIRNFKTEISTRYKLLQATLLNKKRLLEQFSSFAALFDQKQAMESPGGFNVNFTACVSKIQSWINGRYDYIEKQVGNWGMSPDPWVELEKLLCPEKPSITRKYTRATWTSIPGKSPQPKIIRISSTSYLVTLYNSNLNGYQLTGFNVKCSITTKETIAQSKVNSILLQTMENRNYVIQVQTISSAGIGDWSDPLEILYSGQYERLTNTSLIPKQAQTLNLVSSLINEDQAALGALGWSNWYILIIVGALVIIGFSIFVIFLWRKRRQTEVV